MRHVQFKFNQMSLEGLSRMMSWPNLYFEIITLAAVWRTVPGGWERKPENPRREAWIQILWPKVQWSFYCHNWGLPLVVPSRAYRISAPLIFCSGAQFPKPSIRDQLSSAPKITIRVRLHIWDPQINRSLKDPRRGRAFKSIWLRPGLHPQLYSMWKLSPGEA